MSKRFVVTATGDALINRRLPDYQDAPFRSLVDLIKSADIAFTNLETVLANYRRTRVVDPGGDLAADPCMAQDLQRLGFNLTAFANNHTLDYGIEGCLATLDALQAINFTCAGAGRTLAEARLPVFLDVPAGRVGLVGCASTFANMQQAGEQRDDAPGRPGLNPQRYETLYVVDQEHLEAIKRIAERTGAEKKHQFNYRMGSRQPPVREGQFTFAERNFVAGDHFKVRTEADRKDLEGNLRSVRQAVATSDLTLVSIHTHEEGEERWQPADFIIEFAHACVDAGADMVIGHGPHLLRGLELYKGKPIFYSIGNFIFELETPQQLSLQLLEDFYSVGNVIFKLEYLPPLPAAPVFNDTFQRTTRGFVADRLYWETVLPLVTFEDRQPTSIELHPVSLGFGLNWSDRGIPRLASLHAGQEVLSRMTELSAPFGTTIEINDGVGWVDL